MCCEAQCAAIAHSAQCAGKHNVLWSTMCCKAQCCKAQCCKAPFMSQNIYLFLVKIDINVNPFWVAWTRQFVKVWEVPSSMRETLGELLIGSQWPSALLGGSGLQWTLPSLSPWVATNLNSPGYGGMNQASSILSREGELKASRKGDCTTLSPLNMLCIVWYQIHRSCDIQMHACTCRTAQPPQHTYTY